SELKNLALLEHARFWGSSRTLNIYQLQLPFAALRDTIGVIQRLESYGFVNYAVPAFMFRTSATYPLDASWQEDVRNDQSWAQLLIGLPGAWDIRKGNP